MKDSKEISLFINTATKALTLGAIKGDHYARCDLSDPKKALERTHLGISYLGETLGFALADVDNFYCLLGPGSNTGIRLGLTIPRTIYAFHDKIHIYGIKTMDLFTLEAPYAALSDRNGNLFFARKENGAVTYQRVDKKDIPNLQIDGRIAVEKQDQMALEELKGRDILPIDTLELMMKHASSFQDYSNDEENYLPEYLMTL